MFEPQNSVEIKVASVNPLQKDSTDFWIRKMSLKKRSFIFLIP